MSGQRGRIAARTWPSIWTAFRGVPEPSWGLPALAAKFIVTKPVCPWRAPARRGKRVSFDRRAPVVQSSSRQKETISGIGCRVPIPRLCVVNLWSSKLATFTFPVATVVHDHFTCARRRRARE